MERETGTATKTAQKNIENNFAAAENFKEKFVHKVGETKEKVTGNLSSVAGRVHEKSDAAQEYLDASADNLTEFAHQAIHKANQIGHRAADALNNSSEYINNFDFEKTKQQVAGAIREKPQIGLAMAGLFGLIIGLFIGRRNSR